MRRVLHLLPGPGGNLLSPWGAVLLHLHLFQRTSTVVESSCQGHADGLLLMPKLSSPPSSSRGLPAELCHCSQRQNKRSQTCLSLVVVVVGGDGGGFPVGGPKFRVHSPYNDSFCFVFGFCGSCVQLVWCLVDPKLKNKRQHTNIDEFWNSLNTL